VEKDDGCSGWLRRLLKRFARVVTRVLVVASVRLYREGLAAVLGRDDRLDVVGTAAGHHEAVEAVRRQTPDVAVLDPGGDDAEDIVRELAGAAPAVPVVALAVSETDADVVAWAEAGVAGYVTRDGSLDDLVTAVLCAAEGELACSPRMAAALLRRVRAVAGSGAEEPGPALTAREVEIGRLIEQGLSNKEIAQQLHIELPTVKNHVHRILEKLGVHRRAEAAVRLRHSGLALRN
jgi:two-component system nitrate/nitrite response regulator NarL